MADRAQRLHRLRREMEHAPIFASNHSTRAAPPPRAAANRNVSAPANTAIRSALPLVLCALLAASLATGLWLLIRPGALPIRSVRIEGVFAHVTRDELQQAIAGAAQGGLFSIDVGAIRRAAQTLPWVHHVTVRRVWPDGLRVSVTEQRAAAKWNGDALLNSEGVPFKPAAASFPPALPLIEGPNGSERLLLGHQRAMQKMLAPLKLEVTRITMDERRALSAVLSNGTELILGRDEIYPRVTRFTRMYPLLARRGAMQRADLRYSNGLAVRWATTE
ncbi:MAG: cell division protein FtsQ/DivIB [Gammaproteobacteria bacterium]